SAGRETYAPHERGIRSGPLEARASGPQRPDIATPRIRPAADARTLVESRPRAKEYPMGGRPCFSCAPGHETLAAELADLVDGTWETTQGIANVMIMANGATVPGALPAQASDEALAWWQKSVTTTVARTPRSA